MSSVNIGIAHDYYFMVAELFKVEFVSDAASESDNKGVELIVIIDLVKPCLFNIEHFAPHCKNCLES